ncbi:hypothetical protein [Pelobacter propionicus]|nr:hypothetical protein [Pelobacter propionicus]
MGNLQPPGLSFLSLLSLVAELLACGMALTGRWRNRDHYPPLY